LKLRHHPKTGPERSRGRSRDRPVRTEI